MANTCRYAVPTSGIAGELPQVVENALARLITKLPNLRIGIADHETDSPSFVALDSVSIQDVLEWREVPPLAQEEYDLELLRIIETQHDASWPDVHRLPPWKVIVVQPKASPNAADRREEIVLDVVFAVHHSIGDGTGCVVFHQHLLQELNEAPDPSALPDDKVLRFDDIPAVLPAQEQLIKFDISVGHLLWTMWQELTPDWMHPWRPGPPWAGKPVTREPYHLRMRLITIPGDLVPKLLSACRSHGATLTTLLHALVAASLSQRLPADVAQKFVGNTPIGLRPFAKRSPISTVDPTNSMGSFATPHSFTVSEEVVTELRTHQPSGSTGGEVDADGLVWKLATAVRESMKARLAQIPRNDIMGMLAWVSDWKQYWLGQLDKPRRVTWEISNVGSMPRLPDNDSRDKPQWRIEQSIASQSVGVTSGSFVVNVSGLAGSGINLALTWQEGILEEDLVDGVKADLDKWFRHFRETGTLGVLGTE